jgi:hypothetical protein
MHGLVAFPSYHVGLSVIMMVAFRGVKRWFWPIVVLNTLVIMSTPIDGGHHLSDGLGGAVSCFARRRRSACANCFRKSGCGRCRSARLRRAGRAKGLIRRALSLLARLSTDIVRPAR